jgi:nitroreductase
MTEHADAPSNAAHLFEIIRTTRSMRRLKPDPVPNELIRKILEAGVCAPSGGNMQRWRFLVIRDAGIKQTVGAFYKRAWDEQVAPRYRAGEPAPGMNRERFLRLLDVAEYLAAHIHEAPGLDCSLPRRRHSDPHIRFIHLSRGAEHAARGKSARPRRDIDDAVFAVREGSGSGSGLAARRPFLCPAAYRLPDGPVWASPPCRAPRCRL